MNHPNLNYSIELPEKVEQILGIDFWVYTHLTAQLLRTVRDAVKFTSAVSVFVAKGSAEMEVNLLDVKVNAPCLVRIKPDDVVQLKFVTDDFDASFVVMNSRVRDHLLLSLHDAGASPATHLAPVTSVAAGDVDAFVKFYDFLKSLSDDDTNPNRPQAFHHAVLAFYFNVAYRCFVASEETAVPKVSTPFRRNPLVDRFLVLVQQKFKEQRQIEFYASSLGVTSKHLSRILKQSTGFTAADWIKNYILLEAKVMLKSSTLTMGQIAAQLNFPSQSFFAKFFKNATGMTPKQYRNSPE